MRSITMAEVRAHQVRPGSITLWWLGQQGFIFKSPGGKIVAFDPYLSDSCNDCEGAKIQGVDMGRVFPPPMQPADLAGVDLYMLTHTHQDHLDPETIAPYRAAGGKGPYYGPPEVVENLAKLGVPQNELIMTWPNKVFELGDLTIRTTFAIPFGGDDLTHVGYLVSVKGGPKIYWTGDTGYEDILHLSVAPHKPDVMIAVINGGWRNLSTQEAATLTQRINPKVVIPIHWDLMNCNQAFPQTFRTCLSWMGIAEKFRQLEHGVRWTYPE